MLKSCQKVSLTSFRNLQKYYKNEKEGEEKMNQAQWVFASPIGDLYLVASEKGLQKLVYKKQPIAFADSLKGAAPEIKILAETVKQLTEYFSGKRQSFDLTLDIQGTDFQKQVWKVLSKIPFGKTYSYRDVAQKIKNEKAMRAVGTANGRNPVSIVVPCHRVIAADGTLGGYAGGLPAKIKLLQLERAKFRIR